MKICFIMKYHWSYAFGGAEIQVKFLVDKLLELSHDVYFICEKSDLETYKGSRIIALNSNKLLLNFGSSVTSLKIIRLLKDIQPDVIYLRADIGYAFPATLYSQYHKETKVVLHIASIGNVEKYKFENLKQFINTFTDKFLYSLCIKNIELIICQARYQCDLLSSNFKIHRLAIVPNYWNVPEAKVSPDPDKKIVVTWVSNFKINKHPELFVDLAKRFCQYPNAEFYMIGRSSSKWQNLIKNFNLLSNSSYLGVFSPEQVTGFLQNTDILVSTGQIEGFPNIMIQAWMAGIPVLSYRIDPDDVLRNHRLGLVAQSIDELQKGLLLLLNDRRMRTELGERARSYAIENFSMKNLDRLVKLITFDNSIQ